MTVSGILAVAGVIALISAIIGGGIKAKEIEVPHLPPLVRIITSILGLVLLGAALWLETIKLSPAPFSPTSTAEVQDTGAVFTLNNGDEILIKNLGVLEGSRWLNCDPGSAGVFLTPGISQGSNATWQVLDAEGDGVFSLKCLGTGVTQAWWLDGKTLDGTVALKPDTYQFTGTQWRLVTVNAGVVQFYCLGHLEGPRWLNGNTLDGSVNLVVDPTAFSGTRWEIIR
ncbi:MAG: hypothetical protein ABIJ65_03135 [Chloroflexota bacterium]